MEEKTKPLMVTSVVDSENSVGNRKVGLSLFFTILCIVDLFGVFPVITLPNVFISTGVYGIPVFLLVFCLQIYTANLLGRCWLLAEQIDPNIVRKSRYPYAALAEMTFGPRMSNFVTVLLDATVFGAGIPNLLVASQNLQLFGLKMSRYQWDFSFCWWLIIIGILLCPLMWLGSPKDMKFIAMLSVLVVSSVTIITCYCMSSDTQGQYNPSYADPQLKDILIAYGILAFQFDIHPLLLTIQVDMEDKAKIGQAIVGGFIRTMFAITSAVAAHRYGVNVQSNVLQGLPASLPLYFVVLLVTIQLCLSSAVGNSALFQHIEDKLGISRDFGPRRCLIRTSIVGLAVFLGEVVPRFDIVMGVIGSTLTGPLVFILPPLFYVKLLFVKHNCSITSLREDGLRSKNIISDQSKGYQTFTSSSIGENKHETIHHDKDNPKICQNYNSPWKYSNATQTAQISLQAFLCHKDLFICVIIVCFGILATAIATFYSWRDAIEYATFSPSCLVNITAASLSLPI